MRKARHSPRQGTGREKARARADEATTNQELNQAWKARWEARAAKARGATTPATWLTPWKHDYRRLYAGLTKVEATALFLMRTEVIGLNAWLALIRVPNI